MVPLTALTAQVCKTFAEKQASVSTTSFVDKTGLSTCQSRTLCEAKVSLLKKRLNFAVTPANVSAIAITAKVEVAVRPLDAERADTVRRAANSIL